MSGDAEAMREKTVRAAAAIGEFEAWFAARNFPKGILCLLEPGSGLVDGDIWLKLISVPEHLQRQGIGGEVMAKLIEAADGHGVPVTLEAHEVSTDFLGEWYGRFGFEAIGEWGEWGPFMSRPPEMRPVSRLGR